MLSLVILFDWKAKWRPNICTSFCCADWNPDGCIHVQINIKGCIWQTLKDVIRPVSRASGTVISADNTARYASCKLGLISDYPVEESVTFKMAHSQGSLPVIRNVYYGLWSHPVNVCVCVCGYECVFLHAHFSVSWRSVWVLKAIWLSDMDLHFPFLFLINVLQADVLCSCSCSRLHSNIFNADFIDVIEFIQARIASMNFWGGALQTTTTATVKN